MLNTTYVTNMYGNFLWTYWIVVVMDGELDLQLIVQDSPFSQGTKHHIISS